MKVAWKLALSYVVRHPMRMLLTSLAMVASACIVVWVVSGYDSLVAQFDDQAEEYFGRYAFFIVPEDPENAFLDAGLAETLRQDPAVADVTAMAQIQIDSVKNLASASGTLPGPPGTRGQGARSKDGRERMRTGKHAGPAGKREPRAGVHGPGGPDRSKAAGRPARGRGAGGSRRGMRGFGGTPTLVATDALAPPRALVDGTWINPSQPGQRCVVIGSNTAESAGLKPGDEAVVALDGREHRLTVIGVIEDGPSQMRLARRMRPPSSKAPRTGLEAGPAGSALYVPMAVAKEITQGKAQINLICLELGTSGNTPLAQFRTKWEAKIAKSRPVASILGVDDFKAGIEDGMMASRTRQQAWAATGLSLLAALFIIFTTLSMGVTERSRQFAIMRAVGLTRGQVAQVIAIEGILLALIGWGGGLLAGWGLLAVVARVPRGLFQTGASLGTWCIVLTGLSAFGGALAASILPAWHAMSVQPLEAMSPRRLVRPNRFWIATSTLAGLLLIAVNPILVYAVPESMSSDTLYAIYAGVGCTGMAIGFLLLTPATILFVESMLGPLVARFFGLEPRLLRSQLASNLGRTFGTTAALTVGLGLFVAMQVWGYSMLEPFKPGAWVPDVLLAFQRGGLPDAEVDAVRELEGVRADRCIPLAVEQPRLASDLADSENQMSVIRQDNVIMIGLDPQVAFGGSEPLVKARFTDGTPAKAIARLKEGRGCIVPDHFLKATNLKVGDRFAMLVPESPSKQVEYTIVAAVSLPGWHWMTKFSGLRRRSGRSAAIVFANYETVRRDFQLKQINFVWLKVDEKVGRKSMGEAAKILENLDKAAAAQRSSSGMPFMVVRQTMDAKRAAALKVAAQVQPIAERNMGEQQPVNFQGMWPIGATMFGSSLRVSTPAQVHAFIMQRASGMIWASCYLPLITLLVTSLGVVNTVMASVRARRWELGVLRSQGVTRSGLFAMILAEGLLIAVVACLTSLAFGVMAGWCGTGISQYVSFFGGLAPPLVIPWSQLAIGFGIALVLCLQAALWPALATGRAEPLRLLQEGRAAM